MAKVGKFDVIKKIIADVLCIILLFVGLVMVKLHMAPSRRGFSCNDESLTHPYVKETKISTSKVIIIGVAVLILIVIGEIFYSRKSRKDPIKLFKYQIPNWLTCGCHKAKSFVFGSVSTLLVSEVLKRSIGRLRPYFLEICQPNIPCTLPINQNKYFDAAEFSCTSNWDESVREDARLSFPSNHAACVTFFGVFLICYLQSRMTRSCVIPKYLLQVSLVLMISFVSMMRIVDQRHHWSDVAAGILIGFVNALITVFIVADLFRESELKKIEPETERAPVHQATDCDDNSIYAPTKADLEMII